MVINVEYNQLDPLLRATGHADGDVNDETGYSPYPGNINQLVLKLGSYMEELSRTKGAITEFVNPKYKDASKTLFKSSTRLECMMQDYPRTLAPSAKVGFTVLDTWLAYAPVKNNAEDAMKIPEGNPKHSPTSGEIAIYKANCLILQKVLSSPCYFHSSLFYSYHAAFGVLGYCFGSLKVYGPVMQAFYSIVQYLSISCKIPSCLELAVVLSGLLLL
jgi:hypothetical protein